jgi:ATP-dependent RNA helicase DDX3X
MTVSYLHLLFCFALLVCQLHTLAFLVPLVTHIASTVAATATAAISSTTSATPAAPLAIVLAPTRELAIQIELEAHKLTFESPFSCVCVYGGVPARGQLALLAKGVDILVGTPGRMNDFLSRGLIRLANVKFLVLDEADRMLDMGFEVCMLYVAIMKGCCHYIQH